MAYEGKSMTKIREMLRLCVSFGMSARQAGRATRTSHRIVSRNLKKYQSLGLSWEEFEKKSDVEVEREFHKKTGVDTRYQELEEQFKYIEKELGRTGVTLLTLWEEYKTSRLFHYEYSQFCRHFQIWQDQRDVRMHLEHKAGDKLFVDFTGVTLPITDRESGEKREAEVFVAVLGWSQKTYVEASESQKLRDWVRLNVNALEYFGGVPLAIVPDNLKSAVTKSNRYEPVINRTYEAFGRHYGTVILPARAVRPRDKALAEGTVRIIYQRIFAKMRNEVFYSLDELNERIWELLEEHNGKGFQKNDGSRTSLFEEVEKATLKPLPVERFEFRQYQKAPVTYNYHVFLTEDKHWYSVPFRHHKKEVLLAYTGSNVEIYLGVDRIALHRRAHKKWGYTTSPEHMPSHHRFMAEWSSERLTHWAGETGPETRVMVERIMGACGHPEQGFHMSMGVINLAKKYGKERLEMACKRANEFGAYRYRAVKNILEKELDNDGKETESVSLPDHKNIRGQSYYN